ncbi:hypothetical protein [Nocardia pneumoniae]|nr:hypothetical protein [Nocardia pneumoniae]
MRIFHGLTELESAVGTHLGYSDWRSNKPACVAETVAVLVP